MNEPIVEFHSITKRYGATVALADVSLTINAGEVHALVGENGAGKSTLGKVLAGLTTPDSGDVVVSGRTENFSSPRQALSAGITMIAQELSLVPGRSVAENVYLGIEPHAGPFVKRGELKRRFAELVIASGIEVDPDAHVEQLRIGEQQKVEILRALAREARVIIMDEPTARLSLDETRNLLATARQLADSGTTVVFVSHFLEEVLQIADRITVMRDAKIVRTTAANDETKDSLIEAMTGRPLDAMFPHRAPVSPDAAEVLAVRNLSLHGQYSDISLTVAAGEIVVISGLVGAGRTEVLRAIYGDAPATAGTMTLAGAPYTPKTTRDAIRQGIALIPESRKDLGLVMERSVADNVTLPYLAEVEAAGLISHRRERALASERMDRVGVKAASADIAVTTLSGGNQQKVMFARALVRTPVLLLADEPTRGVDVGAKRSIYDLIASLAASGMAVLLVSSEIEEVMGLAHRIVVMHQGQLVAEFDGDTAQEELVIAAAFGAAGGDA